MILVGRKLVSNETVCEARQLDGRLDRHVSTSRGRSRRTGGGGALKGSNCRRRTRPLPEAVSTRYCSFTVQRRHIKTRFETIRQLRLSYQIDFSQVMLK